MTIRSVGIVGLGLIGGSLAKALKKYGGVTDILACGRHPEPLAAAVKEGAVNRFVTRIDESFRGCDVVFICTPVDTIAAQAIALKPFVGKDCIITDVGSVKASVYRELAGETDISFIGGHPMAGSEKIGYAASMDYLFENAYYLLTPYPGASAEQVAALRSLVERIGAIPVILQPDAHDRAVAAISHAPHVIASALVNTARSLDDESHTLRALAAGGFKDITRIASSSPDIWQSISIENQDEIVRVLDVFETQIKAFRAQLTQRRHAELRHFFQEAKEYRDSFQNRPGYMKTYELWVDIPDRPGTIATVTTHLSLNGINIKNIGVVNNREFENGVLQIILNTEEDREKSAELLKGLNFTVYTKN